MRTRRVRHVRPDQLNCCPTRVAHLLTVLLEEARRVHAVGDGAPDHGEPVEDKGGLIGVLEERLAEHVQEDAEEQETGDGDTDLRGQSEAREPLGQGTSKVLYETHGDDGDEGWKGRKRGGRRPRTQEPSACRQFVSRNREFWFIARRADSKAAGGRV